jgi:alpha-glucosidase (family GH31 glycosyl hydrolase)
MLLRIKRPVARVACVVAVALSTAGAVSAQADDPVADPKAVVLVGGARFTVLTPQLVRMEWSAERRFEDRASMVFVNRRLPVPAFTVANARGWTTIETGRMTLRYRPGGAAHGRFAPDSLTVQITVAGKPVTWRPGTKDTGNLRGTTRTLDGVKGATSIEPGLVSRDGWVVVDDSERPLFDDSDWPWVTARGQGEKQDWYFFGHGHAYKDALRDYTLVAGRIPMPPRFAFGTWWSRYWSYTDRELVALVREFEEHDVPLDVLVIDMDWHLTFGTKWWENKKDQSGHTLGWTGYTWNRTLFPDPPALLAWVHGRGLKTTLNMHPASGVQPHEEQYPAMARAMGIDPATKQYVPFDITDKKFAENYMTILHHPLEKQGVDFFWLDWQQEASTKTAGVNPTWWLNYVHTSDMERRGKRPLIFHRWGGLGNHRYQVGFSGDTISVWDSLAFQPFFTATAANVGYGYWSHDIGGHMPGPVDAELYTRWVQFGVFSPILRTHTTKDPNAERRIWAYPVDYARAMRDAFLLRYALVPYLYTASRAAYDTGLSICRPLYYDFPEAAEAYAFEGEYLFGDSLVVAPVTGPVSPASGLASKTVWVPPGEWIEWFTGARLRGPATAERSFTLDELPVYVRAGAVVPMQPKMRHTGEKPVDPLIATIFPGDSGATRVYEDAGDTLGYRHGEAAWTGISHWRQADGARKIEILPVEGSYPGMPVERGYEIRLPGALPPGSVTYQGRAVPFGHADAPPPCWRYDGATLTTTVVLPRTPVTQSVTVVVQQPEPAAAAGLVDGYAGTLARLRGAMTVLNGTWPKGWSPDVLVEAIQTPSRIDVDPTRTLAELEGLARRLPEVVREIKAMDADAAVVERALAHMSGLAASRLK